MLIVVYSAASTVNCYSEIIHLTFSSFYVKLYLLLIIKSKLINKLICMVVLYFNRSLISQTTKRSMAIYLATSDLKIILLQAVVVCGGAIPEFAWRNSGKQKETAYIRRCQAKIRT